MCCFTGPVHVHGTRIFARVDRRGAQGLIYEMTYESTERVAMVLPIPVAAAERDRGDRAVRFIDLSGYADFFDAIERGWWANSDGDDFPEAQAAHNAIPVVRVGAFDASYVPRIADFARLDARFRLDDRVWRSLPQYASYGFAVFQLGAGNVHVHPMAFMFKTAEPKRVFFPTVHVHDGTVPAEAKFDHALYMQTHTEPPLAFWDKSPELAGEFLDVARAQRLVLAKQPLYRKEIRAVIENKDTWMWA